LDTEGVPGIEEVPAVLVPAAGEAEAAAVEVFFFFHL
jgi:hypothetical protein